MLPGVQETDLDEAAATRTDPASKRADNGVRRESIALAYDANATLGEFDSHHDGKLHKDDLTRIADKLEHEHSSYLFFKRATVFLGVLVVAVAVALGGTTYAAIEGAIREPTTEPHVVAAGNGTTDGFGQELLGRTGAQVTVAQSGQEVMISSLRNLMQHDPLKVIKAMPEMVVLNDPAVLPIGRYTAYRISKAAIDSFGVLSFFTETGERVVIWDAIYGTVFRTDADYQEWSADADLTIDRDVNGWYEPAVYDENDTMIENATMHRPAGVFEDGRWHFCAACVPVELKSLLHSAKIEAAHADFLAETENSSCVAVNNYIDFDFGIRSNIAARMEDTGTTMTYTPPVCYTHQSDDELNYTDPDHDNDGANRDRRIWNGELAGSNEFRPYVKIGHKDGNGNYHFSCGGTLISRHIVMTAGHCVGEGSTPYTDFQLHIGFRTNSQPGTFRTASYLSHVSYDGSDDIAFLRLDDCWYGSIANIATVDSGMRSGTALQVSSGSGCRIDSRGCATDGPFNYTDNAQCTISVPSSGKLTATYFAVENGYDHVTIGGTRFTGSDGPDGVDVDAGSTFTWFSDHSVTDVGWTICLDMTPEWTRGTVVGAGTREDGRFGDELHHFHNAPFSSQNYGGLGPGPMWYVDTPTVQHVDSGDSGTGLYVPGYADSFDTVIGVTSMVDFVRGETSTKGYFVRTVDHYAAIDAAIRSQPSSCSAHTPASHFSPPQQYHDSCHPASSTVQLQDGRARRMDELQVGDQIRTASGFEPAIGFTHQDASVAGDYLVLTTRSTTVKISPAHYLFVNGVEADPATVNVGDVLSTTHGPEPVLTISESTEHGAYHLLTPSGTYFVDNVLSTAYIAEVPRPVWSLLEKYAHLRYLLGVPVAPESADDGTVPLDALYHVYHGKVPAAVESLLLPAFVLSGLVIELYNLVVLSGLGQSTLVAVVLAGAAQSAGKRVHA